jgi:hypothetical protein
MLLSPHPRGSGRRPAPRLNLGRIAMLSNWKWTVPLVALAILTSVGAANAFDDAKYPDWNGQWARAPLPRGVPQAISGPQWDPTKPEGRGQQAPLTEEYQAIFEANLADQKAGGQGVWPGANCLMHGMPAAMTVIAPMEIIVLPKTTYFVTTDTHASVRRIFTDGRNWPDEIEPAFLGYSIGHWIDEDGDGRYDVLEIETRGFKGPRAFDHSGIPLHEDNQTIIKERIFLDKASRDVLHNQITVFDHALTHPWTVNKEYRRNPNPRPVWHEIDCAEGNQFVVVGKEMYMVSADGHLMPVKKGQAAPDLKYFLPTLP